MVHGRWLSLCPTDCPLLFIAGDTFTSRLPDPVLQQVEHFGVPSTTVNDAFRPVVRYWDRITHPAQILSSLPQAVATMLDPGDCGPAFIGLPQDVARRRTRVPQSFDETIHESPPTSALTAVSSLVQWKCLRSAQRPAIIAGGGAHYSRAEAELGGHSHERGIPVVETVAGKSSLVASRPRCAGAGRCRGSAEAADAGGSRTPTLILAHVVGHPPRGLHHGFVDPVSGQTQFVGLNAARFDAIEHRSTPLVADAREGLTELSEALGNWSTDASWTEKAARLRGELDVFVNGRIADDGVWPPSYAQLVGLVHQAATEEDYVLTAAGGLQSELDINWMTKRSPVSTVNTDIPAWATRYPAREVPPWHALAVRFRDGRGWFLSHDEL